MKKNYVLSCFVLLTFLLGIPLFPQSNANTYREISIQRYNLQKNSFPAGERFCLKRVTLWTDFNKNCVSVAGNSTRFFASMSDEATNWLLDYSETDSKWDLRYLNIYGVILKEAEGEKILNDKFRIEKIEFN